MDSSWKSPVEPPKDWVKKYYEKPGKGPFRRWSPIYRLITMNIKPNTQKIIVGVFVFIFFWPLAIKPVWYEVKYLWKHPDQFDPFTSKLTKEEKEEIRRKNLRVHTLKDLGW